MAAWRFAGAAAAGVFRFSDLDSAATPPHGGNSSASSNNSRQRRNDSNRIILDSQQLQFSPYDITLWRGKSSGTNDSNGAAACDFFARAAENRPFATLTPQNAAASGYDYCSPAGATWGLAHLSCGISHPGHESSAEPAMIHRATLFALALAFLAASGVASAATRDRTAVGTLECRSPGTISVIISFNEYDCRFFSRNGRAYRYTGSIRRLGFDFGITGHQVLVWQVFAPTSRVDRNALRGNYAGAHAGVGVLVGVGANALVGGSGNTISLQPVSVEATTGVNIALSVAGLSLY
jgi:hypothetical protein